MLWWYSLLLLNLLSWSYEWQLIKVLEKLKLGTKAQSLYCCDEKMTKRGLFYLMTVRSYASNKKNQARTSRRERRRSNWSRGSGGMLLTVLLIWISYIPEDHLPRDGTTQRSLKPSTAITNHKNDSQASLKGNFMKPFSHLKILFLR